MSAGQPALLWISGNRRRLTPGIWAVGSVTGPAAATDGKLRVPLELHWLEEGERVHRDVLRADERLAGVEVLRQPQAANPSFLTTDQLTTLRSGGLGQIASLLRGKARGHSL